MKLAIMQPYFMPYAGYFRLIASVDVFVVYDCVQFARRGRVHRNQLTTASGERDWLTLPLQKAPQSTAIHALQFAEDATERMQLAMQRFPALSAPDPLVQAIRRTEGEVVDYLEHLLGMSCQRLGLEWKRRRSSSLRIAEDLHGQDRILAICKALGATEYFNLPGGRALYDAEVFAKQGINLQFIPPFTGNTASMLERLLLETPEVIRAEL